MQPTAPTEIAGSSRRVVVAGTLVALFLAAIDQTVVSTALPRIIADLGGLDMLAWVFTSYMLASTIIVPLAGKLGDQYGRKPLFLIAIVTFLAGSFASGAAQSMLQLVLFRALQGVGAGMLFATAFAVVGDLYAPLERGKIQGLFSGVFGIASVVGPALGGWITDVGSWRWVFYINLPVGIIALTVITVGMPHLRPHERRTVKLDLLGAALLVVALLPFLLAMVWADDRYPWGAWQLDALLGVSILGLLLFLLAEHRAAEPVLPLSLFRNRTFVVSAVVLLFVGAGMFGAITMVPLLLQGAKGVTASRAGSLTMPMTLAVVAASATAGQLMSRNGRYKRLVYIGTATMAAGLLLFSRVNEGTSLPLIIGCEIVTGLGLGCTMPVFTVIVQNALPFELLGVATSGVQFFRSVGGTIGVAVFTGIMLRHFRAGLDGTSADVPVVTGQLSKLLNERGVNDVRQAYEATGGAATLPWSVLQSVIRVHEAEAIALVFLIAACVVACAIAAACFLPELELQRVAPAELARRHAAAGGAQADAASEDPALTGTAAAALDAQPASAVHGEF